jgi:hypothetical protein
VKYTTNAATKAAGDTEPYKLAASYKNTANTTHTYLYYMGYVQSVPMAYKTSYFYNGITPITITWEKNWATEEGIAQSLTKAKDETWSVNSSVTVGMEITAKGGVPLVAEAEIKASVSATVGSEYGGTISTSQTYETTQSKVSGESESISATIGEHGEPNGNYRYALFGVTDVFCSFEVDPATHAIKKVEIIECVRATSLAWGIDYSTANDFGQTGSSGKFEPPVVDFATLPDPTIVLEGTPQPVPQERAVTKTNFQDIPTAKITYGHIGGSDAEMNTGPASVTTGEIEAKFSINPSRTSIHVTLLVTATEKISRDGRSMGVNSTVNRAYYEFDIPSEGGAKIHALSGQTLDGEYTYITLYKGDHSGAIGSKWIPIEGEFFLNPIKNSTLLNTSILMDGPGNDADADGIGIKGDIMLYYTVL